MGPAGRFWLIGLAVLASLIAAPEASATSPLANWAVLVVSGDWHAHSGAPSEVFDNARRDLTKAFIDAGFSPANVSQFSSRPPAPPAAHPRHGKGRAAKPAPAEQAGPPAPEPNAVHDELLKLTQQAPDGCLIYFTSHGAPTGVLVDGQIWPPGLVAGLVDSTCGQRPTVVVISACFSGVFVNALSGPNRMVLTAARPDRTSFGCGEANQYTYFDGCVLTSLPHAHDFAALGVAARACVAQKEAETGASPPSEPQMDVGPVLRPMLPLYAFVAPPNTRLTASKSTASP